MSLFYFLNKNLYLLIEITAVNTTNQDLITGRLYKPFFILHKSLNFMNMVIDIIDIDMIHGDSKKQEILKVW